MLHTVMWNKSVNVNWKIFIECWYKNYECIILWYGNIPIRGYSGSHSGPLNSLILNPAFEDNWLTCISCMDKKNLACFARLKTVIQYMYYVYFYSNDLTLPVHERSCYWLWNINVKYMTWFGFTWLLQRNIAHLRAEAYFLPSSQP